MCHVARTPDATTATNPGDTSVASGCTKGVEMDLVLVSAGYGGDDLTQ